MTSPRVPVIMYHKIGAKIGDASDTFVNVSSADFSRQMRLMVRLGYHAVTFSQVVAALNGAARLPRRSFAITFDDGYQSVIDHAGPILAELDFTATVFAVSDLVGRANEWDRAAGYPVQPLMTWDSLADLKSRGWEIAGHTRSHPHLDRLSRSCAMEEVVSGKLEIENRLGARVETFCYPFGHFNSDTVDMVRRAGFRGACTTHSGIANGRLSPYLLPRVKISYSDGISGLLYKLTIRPVMPSLRRDRRGSRLEQPGVLAAD